MGDMPAPLTAPVLALCLACDWWSSREPLLRLLTSVVSTIDSAEFPSVFVFTLTSCRL